MGANQTTPGGETSHGVANCFLKEKQLLGVQLLWVRIKQLLGEKHLMGERIVSLKRNNSWGGTAPEGANQTTPGGETSHGGANHWECELSRLRETTSGGGTASGERIISLKRNN